MDAQVGVIGVGSMGSMAMWKLAKQGISTIGFEQYTLGHDRSAAGGESRAFRTAYLEGAEYVPLLMEAQKQWRELESDTNQDLLTLNGGLMIGQENHASMKNIIRCIRDFDLDHEILEGDLAKKYYPQHLLERDEILVLDKQAGFVKPELAVLSASRKSRDLGSTLLRNSRVNKIQPNGRGVSVHTNEHEYRFEKVIVSAGPWLDQLIPVYRQNFQVHKLILTWFAAKKINRFTPEKFPVFVRLNDEINLFGIPSLDGNMVKISPIADQSDELITDPDNINRDVRQSDIENLIKGVSNYFPDIIPEPIRASSYMDGFTSDCHPVVGFAPNYDNIIVAGGFSGHGFKMAPVIGEILAELATLGFTKHNISHLDPGRFMSKVL